MINLANDLYLDVDQNNFILKVKTVGTDKTKKNYGKTTYAPKKYAGDLGQLLESGVMLALRSEDYNTLKEMQKAHNKLIKEFKQNIRQLDFEKLKAEIDK